MAAKKKIDWPKEIKKAAINTAMVAPVGRAAKIGSTVVKAVAGRGAEKAATKVGQKVGKEVAERMPASKYPSSKGKPVLIRLEGKSTTMSAKGGRSTTGDSLTVQGTKRGLSEKQRLGVAQATETKRNKAIVTAADIARKAAKPVIAKEKAKSKVVGAGLATVPAYIAGKNSNKKSGKK